jgi:hypothetical protein
MPEQDVRNLSAILDELIKAEESLLRLSQLIHDDLKAEVESMSAIGEMVRNDRDMASTAFQNFDQKSNQLHNLLSTVMKAMKEMRMATVRNML